MALNYQLMKKAVKAVVSAGNVPNIVGEAGIGKSALVEEVAHEKGAALFTTVVSLAEKGDLAVPVPPMRDEAFIKTTQYGTLANVQYGYSETLIQIIQQAEKEPTKPIIWFLDEFNRGTVAVQSELMNLVLQRRVNSLQLPDQVHIIIAENPDDSMSGFDSADYSVTPADAALKDRTVRLVMEASLADWLSWAQQTNSQGQPMIQPVVQTYLKDHPDYLNGPQNEDLYPTPRSWQRVSNNLGQLRQLPTKEQAALMPDVFSGDLGTEVGVAFADYVLHHEQQLSVDDLVNLPANQVLDSFKRINDGDKVQLLQQLIQQSPQQLTEQSFLERLMQFLKTLSSDGQYAVIQAFGKVSHQHPAILQTLYQQAQAGNTTAKNFYEYLQRIVAMM